MSDLEAILDLLSEDTIARKVYIPHDEARESYKLGNAKVNGFEEFTSVITDYYKHHFSSTVSGKVPMPDDMAAGYARRIVEEAYGKEGGISAALDYAQTGERGGLRRVLDTIAEALKREHEENYIHHVYDTYINPLDAEQQIQLVQEYFKKFQAYLPERVLKTPPAYYARDWKSLLNQHREILKVIRARMH